MRDLIARSLRPLACAGAERDPDTRSDGHLTPAAVLVAVVERGADHTVLLTRRTDHLADHAGQISFPGGRVEPHDRDPVHTALRETEEETGVAAGFVEAVGLLDTYRTGTGFVITPVVGMVAPGFTVSPDPFEVADVFEVPLRFLLDPGNHRTETRMIGGAERTFWVIEYRDRHIWGATAAMLVNFYRRLAAAGHGS